MQIQWTAPSLEEARRIARVLIEIRLAACANLIPGVESIYTWEGKLETAQEVKVILKTTPERAFEVEAYIQKHCSYETPEISVFAADRVNEPYLEWIKVACKPPSH